jgi:uncharacterized membrane protein
MPTAIDGISQYYLKIESNNLRRILSGIPCGISLGFLFIKLKSITFI